MRISLEKKNFDFQCKEDWIHLFRLLYVTQSQKERKSGTILVGFECLYQCHLA